jgi:hypothetical protein
MDSYPITPIGFVPCGLTSIQATPVSSSADLPASGASMSLLVLNLGPSTVYVALGGIWVFATLASLPIMPGQSVLLQQGYASSIAAVTVAGDSIVYVQSGIGPLSPIGENPMPFPFPYPQVVTNLQPYSVGATGSTQQTAAIVPFLANILINSASAASAGIMIAVPAEKWNGAKVPIANFSGLSVLVYLYTGDSFINQAANTSIELVNTQAVVLSVSQSGAVVPGV